MSILVVLVPQLEGRSLHAYLDTARVPTICYGHTATARMGQTRTVAECDELLRGDLGIALAAVRKNVKVPVSDSTEAALASFTFNVGRYAFEQSTLLRLLNQGKVEEACLQLKRWNCERAPKGWGDKTGNCATAKRDHRYSKGLANRREKEIAVCLSNI